MVSIVRFDRGCFPLFFNDIALNILRKKFASSAKLKNNLPLFDALSVQAFVLVKFRGLGQRKFGSVC